jgi:hypothetical protein
MGAGPNDPGAAFCERLGVLRNRGDSAGQRQVCRFLRTRVAGGRRERPLAAEWAARIHGYRLVLVWSDLCLEAALKQTRRFHARGP